MKKFLLFLLLLPCSVFAQDWRIVDIISQSKKELIYKVDDGEKIERVKEKNPSIVRLIQTYTDKGYVLQYVTQGVELELDGMLPVTTANNQRNWGTTQLTLDNNNRVMLWFKKKE